MNKKINMLTKMGLSASLAMICTNLLTKATFASDSGIIKKADEFVSTSEEVPLKIPDIIEILLPVTNILFTIATAVLVIVGLVIGVKYMMSEPNDKAKIKEKVLWYFVAIILVYAGVAIAQLVANLFLSNI